MKPVTPNQIKYHNLLSSKIPLILATGPAGSGKTLLASYAGAQKLATNQVARLVLTRPAVSVDEQHGYLPGTVDQKMEPWTRPIFDALGRFYTQRQINTMMYDKVIEVCPLAYMRGRTFDNSWIIADEMQNSTQNQMKMILTRIGVNSQMVVTGDLTQCETGYDENGLIDFMTRLGYSEHIKSIQLDSNDILRSEVVKEILKYYSEN
jgi:phosphate starvation-inducible PhoH-like protein